MQRWHDAVLPQHFQESSPLPVSLSSLLHHSRYPSSGYLLPLCHSSCIPTSSSLSHSIFAHSLDLPRFNFVPIHLDLSARLLHKQCCYSVRIHNWRGGGELANAFWICTCACAQGLCMTASRLMRDLSRCIFTSSPSPPILCSFTSSLHLCLPFFPLRNLLSPFQWRMNNIRRHSAVRLGAQLPVGSSRCSFSRYRLEPPHHGSHQAWACCIRDKLIIHNFTVKPQSVAAAWGLCCVIASQLLPWMEHLSFRGPKHKVYLGFSRS